MDTAALVHGHLVVLGVLAMWFVAMGRSGLAVAALAVALVAAANPARAACGLPQGQQFQNTAQWCQQTYGMPGGMIQWYTGAPTCSGAVRCAGEDGVFYDKAYFNGIPGQCESPLVEVNGQCVDPCAAKAGKRTPTGPCSKGGTCVMKGDIGGAGIATVCDGNCKLSGYTEMVGKVDGQWYTWANDFKYSGQSCIPGETMPNYNTPIPCTSPNNGVPGCQPPKGKCPGEVNGVMVYVECTTTSTTTTSTTSSSTSTSSTTAGGTTTSTTNTTCTNGQCTTTTTNSTNTGTGGPPVVTITGTTEPKSTFCEKNPTSPHCGNGPPSGDEDKPSESTFGGSCGTFTCTGDAATCAIARAANETKCRLDSNIELEAVATQLKNGTFASDLATKAASVSNFTQTNPFGSTCPGDQALSLMGHSFTVPLASVCSELQTLGNLLLAFTLIWATIFVTKGF